MSLFEEAEQKFDLDKLRADLERTGKITSKNWEYLKGILCGLEQKEIAEQCFAAKGTVKTALTRGVRGQILGLLPDKSKVDWKRLPAWLIEAGYGIGKNRPIDWRQVCRYMLDLQIESSTLNDLMAKDGVRIDPELFVSVGLVERKQKKYRRSEISSAEQSSQLLQPTDEEVVQRFDDAEAFFKQIISNPDTSSGSRLVITGEPGAGKTTLLQKIGDRLLQEEMLPIWISLGKEGVSPTRAFLSRILRENAQPQDFESATWESSINALLQTGKVWLLLDGADELATNRYPLRVIGEYLQEAWASQVTVVLTCRLNAWDTDALPKFKVFRTLEFDYQTPVEQYRNQVEAYIYQFFAKEEVNSPLADALIQELYKPSKERVRDSVKNPLRLSLLCYVWQSGIGELPNTRAELYRLFVDYYYELQERKHPEDSELGNIDRTERDKLNLALGEVAKAALDSDDSQFRLRKSLIESIPAMGQSDAEGSLFDKAIQLGWLNLIGVTAENPYEPAYAFFHASFQEYFATLAIDDWNYFLPREHEDKLVEGKDNEYRIFQPQWREVFLLWLGRLEPRLEPQKIELLNKLVSFKDGCGEFYNFRAHFLAVTGFAETNDFPNANEIIENLLSYALGDNRFFNVFTEHARKALVNTNQYLLSLALVKLLRSEQKARVLADAIEFIEETRLNTPEIIEELTQLLELTTNGRLRCLAACALAKIYPSFPNILGIIIHYLNEEDYQYDTARCLGELGRNNSEIRDALRNCLKTGFGTVDPFNDTSYLVVASSLLKINPGDEIAISFLNYLLAQPWGRPLKIMIAKLLKQNGYVDMTINEILKNSDPFVNELIETLKNLDIGDFRISELDSKLINTVIVKLTEKLRSCQEKETFESISYCLEIIFSGDRFEIMNEALFSIPVGFQGRTLEETQKNSTVLWYCAENMNYPDFFKALQA